MATPTLVQSASGSTCANVGGGITKYDIRFSNVVLNANAVSVCIQNGGSSTDPSSVTDDKSNTYTQIGTGSGDTSNGQKANIYVATNITNSPRTITVNWGSATQYCIVHIQEWYNIATSSPGDGSSAAAFGTGTTATATSFTPTYPGGNPDLILNMVFMDSVIAVMDRWTQGSGFTMISADVIDGQAVQYKTATSGAQAPTMGLSASLGWCSYAVALKSAAAGTAPSATALLVQRDQHHNFSDGSAATPYKVQFPGQGNCFVLRWVGSPSMTITSITDTGGNTWSQLGSAVNNGGSGIVQQFYCYPTSLSNTLQLTVNWSNTIAVGTTLHILDIVNADTTFTPTFVDAQNTAVTTTITAASITPGQANGLVVDNLGCNLPSITGTSGVMQFTSDIVTPTPATSPVDENNGNSVYYNPNTTAVQVTYVSSAAVGAWADKVIWLRQNPVLDILFGQACM